MTSSNFSADLFLVRCFVGKVSLVDRQGWEESRYSLDRAWLEAILWLEIGLERHLIGCRRQERYIFLY